LKSGAGLVYLAVPKSLAGICSTMFHEPVILPFEDEDKGYFLNSSFEALKSRLDSCNAVALGPGMSLNEETVKLVHSVIEYINRPVVIDADALNAVSKDISVLKKLKAPAVITPHPGEMARLAGITIEQVQNNRIEIAREFACKWNTITVLKGAATVVASPDGIIYINTTGNSGMATAGAGDVLTGLIAGLIAQGAQAFDAAVAGVYLHGLAGDIQAKIIGEHGLTAGDILNEIPYAMKSIIKNSKNN
jgi:NAD(P)H-hydrate epimerase